MLKKSLFTQRQIEIILNFKNIELKVIRITKVHTIGRYHSHGLSTLYYSIVLLRVLALLPDDPSQNSRTGV